MEDFLAVLEPEHFFAENEKLCRNGVGGGRTAGKKAARAGGRRKNLGNRTAACVCFPRKLDNTYTSKTQRASGGTS